jgi:hypothetical protein
MGGDMEYGTCEYCGNEGPVGRQYFNYDIDCDCCRGKEHFEIVWHCDKCEPKDPGIRKIQLNKKLKHKI